jgi:ethanolamine utilization protein EutN
MNLARVVGRVVSTCKDEALVGHRILVLAPLDAELKPAGSPLLALDSVGAGAAEIVTYVRGREASHAFAPASVPTDACVVGIVDHVTVST